MRKRLTLAGPMLAFALVAGSAATSASAQPVSGPYLDFIWDSRNNGGQTLFFFNAAGVPITTADYLCGLVQIWGEFRQGVDSMNLGSNEIFGGVGGQWYLAGSNVRPHGATARCVRLENFSSFTGCYGGGNCMRFQNFDTTSPNWQWMWWSDAISTLNGMAGPFDGGGENVGVWPWSDPSSITGVTFYSQAFSGAPQATRMWSRSTYLGSRTFYAGRYTLRDGRWGGTEHAQRPGFTGSTNEKFCYIASVAGKFRGAGEVVGIRSGFNDWTGLHEWIIYADTGADLGLRADVECVWY